MLVLSDVDLERADDADAAARLSTGGFAGVMVDAERLRRDPGLAARLRDAAPHAALLPLATMRAPLPPVDLASVAGQAADVLARMARVLASERHARLYLRVRRAGGMTPAQAHAAARQDGIFVTASATYRALGKLAVAGLLRRVERDGRSEYVVP